MGNLIVSNKSGILKSWPDRISGASFDLVQWNDLGRSFDGQIDEGRFQRKYQWLEYAHKLSMGPIKFWVNRNRMRTERKWSCQLGWVSSILRLHNGTLEEIVCLLENWKTMKLNYHHQHNLPFSMAKDYRTRHKWLRSFHQQIRNRHHHLQFIFREFHPAICWDNYKNGDEIMDFQSCCFTWIVQSLTCSPESITIPRIRNQ